MMIDYETEYDNRARVPEHAGIVAGWAADAAAYRSAAQEHAQMDVAYGPSPRQGYDMFRPALQKGDALAVFIHGGGGEAPDRASFSHMARGLNTRGVPVAVVGYDVCPEVSVAAMINELREGMAALWRRFEVPLVVCGHSAGGHLAACLLATDWPAFAPGLPHRLVRSSMALSGVFDLAPLVYTSLNDMLLLDEPAAKAASPFLWPAPAGATLDAIVGGDESAEYHRQSRVITDIWGLEGVSTRYEPALGANHYTVIAPLAEPESALVNRLCRLAGVEG
jgi:arylformamidase